MMSNASWLWDQLHDQFDTDDGSLPDVYVEYQKPEALVSAYLLLRDRATAVVTERPDYWSTSLQQRLPLDTVPNASMLVLSGEAEPFHVVFGGITAKGVVIPDLGVFVFQECIALDYRMGSEWGPPELDAFFELLVELSALDPACRVALDDGQPVSQASFNEAFHRFRRERSARMEC
ncbi:hypothetical protein [Aeoliella sp. SH292]|uniref:hypothetical protein n=1 Tax=Aeoliella sp. SH292 TaxID=3454464 RepID=UPI003F9D7FD8